VTETDAYRVVSEVRAFGYETELLRHLGTERAIGMCALVAELSERCHLETAPEDLLTEQVTSSVAVLRDYMAETADIRLRLAVEHGERSRPYSLTPYEEYVARADIAAARAYFIYTRFSSVWQDSARQYPGSCLPVSIIMQQELRRQGIESQHRWRCRDLDNHHFLSITMPDDSLLYVDPTWQQFLARDTDLPSQPNVLVAPADRLAEILTSHGVPEAQHDWWSGATVEPEAENGNQWHSWVLRDYFQSKLGFRHWRIRAP
jgi:hypothetical protein